MTTREEHKTITQLLKSRSEDSDAFVQFWNHRGKGEHLILSYSEMYSKARIVAQNLIDLGVKPKEKVILVLSTGPDFFYAFMGTLLSGAVPSAIYPPVRIGRLDEWKESTEHAIKSIEAKIVLTEKRLFNSLRIPILQAKPPLGIKLVREILEQTSPKRSELPHVNESDYAFIQFSSGSTGKPKPVAITHRCVMKNTRAIIETFKFKPGELHCVSWLPLYHDMGLVGAFFVPMVSNGPLTLIPPEIFVADPKCWIEAISATKATISVAPNFAYNICVSKVDDSELVDIDLSHWKIALNGAEATCPNTLREFCEKYGKFGFNPKSMSPVYGLAEATLAVTFSNIQDHYKVYQFDKESLELDGIAKKTDNESEGIRITSVGKPLTDIRVEIKDSSRARCDDGEVGTVWVKSPSIMSKYFGMPEQTNKVIVDGKLNTGDRGFIFDEELFIYGREKDVIIINGRNYDPSVVERCLLKLPSIRTGCAASFGILDEEKRTEKLVILAEVKRRISRKSKEEIIKSVKEAIQSYVGIQASEIELLKPGTLPRTSSGKIRRSLTKRLWLRKELRPPKKISLLFKIKSLLGGL